MKRNVSATKNNSNRFIAEALLLMKDYCDCLIQHKIEAATTTNTVNDPELKCRMDEFVDYISYDTYLLPFIILSDLIISKAENLQWTTSFTTGLTLQAGKILTTIEKDNDSTKFFKKLLSDYQYSIDVLLSARSQNCNDYGSQMGSLSFLQEDSTFSIPGNAQNTRASIRSNILGTHTNSANITNGNDNSTVRSIDINKELEYYDLSIAKDSLRNLQLLYDMATGDILNDGVVTAAEKLLKVNYKVTLDDKGKVTGGSITSKPVLSTAPTPTQKRGRKVPSRDALVDTRPATTTTDARINRQSSVSAIVSNLLPQSVNAIKSQISAPYQPDKHDFTTVKAEILLLVDNFGRTDISAWVQWALGNIGGIGYGILGQASFSPKDDYGFDKSKLFEGMPDHLFLLEVRNRLIEVDQQLIPVFDGSNSNYGWGKLEGRLLINLVLVKLSAQLNMKKDTGLHINMVDTLITSLKDTHKSIECDIYYAINERFKVDFAEWNMSVLLDDEKKLDYIVMTILPLAKKYKNATDLIDDLELKRDSYKKLINIYIDASNIKGVDNGNAHSGASVQSASVQGYDTTSDDGSVRSISNSASVAGKRGGNAQLNIEEMTEEAIDATERVDKQWVRRYGQIRAKYYMKKLRGLAQSFQ